MAQPIQELKSMTDEELHRLYDKTAPNVSLGLQFYRDEIAHRENAEQTQTIVAMTERMVAFSEHMDEMTNTMVTLTKIVAVLTVVSAAGAIAAAVIAAIAT